MLTDRIRAVSTNRGFAIGSLLFAVHIIGAAALPVVLSIGRPRFMAFYLIAVGSMLFLDLLVVTRTYRDELLDVPSHAVRFVSLRAVLVLLLACVALVSFGGQSSVVLLLLSLAIFSNIVVLGNAERPGRSIASLASMIFAAVLLLWSETSKGVLFTGSGDTVGHLDTITAIVRSGSLLNLPSGRLASYPLTHIASAEAVLVSGGDVYVMSITYLQLAISCAVLFTFVTVRNLTDQRTAAIAAGVFSALPTLVSAGSRLHYQSFSFVFSCLFIMLAVGMYRIRADKLIFVVVSAWIVTHHVSLLLSLPFLFILLIAYGRNDSDAYPRYLSFLFLSLAFVYTYYSKGTLFGLINWVFVSNPPGGVPGGYSVDFYNDLFDLIRFSISDFLNYVYYIPLTAIPAAGVVLALGSRAKLTDIAEDELSLLVATAPAFIVFVPTPLWILLEGTGQLSRWFSVLAPFMIITVAITARYFIQRGFELGSRSNANLALLLLVTLLVLSAPNTGDLNGMAGYEGEPRRYIAESEMQAIDHVVEYPNSGQVHSYTHIPRYIDSETVGGGEVDGDRLIRVQLTGSEGLPRGLSIISNERLSESLVSIRKCVERDTSRICSGFATISVDADSVGAGSSKAYTNGDTTVYWVP